MRRTVLLFLGMLFASVLVQAADKPQVATSQFKDWQLSCVKNNKNETCEIRHTVFNRQKKPKSVLSLAKYAGDRQLFRIVLPHQLDLRRGVKLSVDKNKPIGLPFHFCNRDACFVDIVNNKDLVTLFKKGNTGLVEAVTIANQPWQIKFSLSGFSAAYNSLK